MQSEANTNGLELSQTYLSAMMGAPHLFIGTPERPEKFPEFSQAAPGPERRA
jgi:hypothetical protein